MKYRVVDFSTATPEVIYQGKSRCNAMRASNNNCAMMNWLEGIDKKWNLEFVPKNMSKEEVEALMN